MVSVQGVRSYVHVAHHGVATVAHVVVPVGHLAVIHFRIRDSGLFRRCDANGDQAKTSKFPWADVYVGDFRRILA